MLPGYRGHVGSASSTGPRPARAPDTVVSATEEPEEPVTSRSTGTEASLSSMIVTMPRPPSGPGQVPAKRGWPAWRSHPAGGMRELWRDVGVPEVRQVRLGLDARQVPCRSR